LPIERAERDSKAAAVSRNGQTAEGFRQEALKLVEQTRKIQWVQPSRVESEEVPIPVPPDEELAESTPEVRGSAVRGRVLHKLMEEILLGETRDDDSDVRARAGALLLQLGAKDYSDPSQGPSSQEISSTIRRTLRLPAVAKYRESLEPELGMFGLRTAENGNRTAIAGIVDAITQEKNRGLEVIIDWKSDVAPAAETRQRHAAQVREYLSITGAAHGFVVYMTTGEVLEVSRKC